MFGTRVYMLGRTSSTTGGDFFHSMAMVDDRVVLWDGALGGALKERRLPVVFMSTVGGDTSASV
jgi:hypothetical protein